MTNSAWLQLLPNLPQSWKDSLVVKTISGTELSVQSIVRIDESFIVIRGRVAGTTEQGQVYFVHNRVQSIERVHERMTKLLPGVRFGVMHGQMPVESLETVMKAFLKGEIDCLISTCIVPSSEGSLQVIST